MGNAPPPTLASLSTTSLSGQAARSIPRGGAARRSTCQLREIGISRQRPARDRDRGKRRLERGEREFVDANERESGFLRRRRPRRAGPTMIPACGPPRSLSPLIVTIAAPPAPPRRRSVHPQAELVERNEQAAAEIVQERDAASARASLRERRAARPQRRSPPSRSCCGGPSDDARVASSARRNRRGAFDSSSRPRRAARRSAP